MLHATTKLEFFHELKAYCTALNPEILEGLVEDLGEEEARRTFNDFIREYRSFEHTKLKDLIGRFDATDCIPPEYSELKVKLGENWHDKTLADLKRLKRQVSMSHWILSLIEAGSIMVTFFVPSSENLQLESQREYLESQDVLQIHVTTNIFKSGGEYYFNARHTCKMGYY